MPRRSINKWSSRTSRQVFACRNVVGVLRCLQKFTFGPYGSRQGRDCQHKDALRWTNFTFQNVVARVRSRNSYVVEIDPRTAHCDCRLPIGRAQLPTPVLFDVQTANGSVCGTIGTRYVSSLRFRAGRDNSPLVHAPIGW